MEIKIANVADFAQCLAPQLVFWPINPSATVWAWRVPHNIKLKAFDVTTHQLRRLYICQQKIWIWQYLSSPKKHYTHRLLPDHRGARWKARVRTHNGWYMFGYPLKLGHKNLFTDSLILFAALIGNHSHVKDIKEYARSLGRTLVRVWTDLL